MRYAKERAPFNSFRIECLTVALLPEDVSCGNTLMILTELNFVLALWIL